VGANGRTGHSSQIAHDRGRVPSAEGLRAIPGVLLPWIVGVPLGDSMAPGSNATRMPIGRTGVAPGGAEYLRMHQQVMPTVHS